MPGLKAIGNRRALEALAARQTAQNATPDDIATLQAILEEMREHSRANNLLLYSDTNGRLHRAVIRIADGRLVGREELNGAAAAGGR